MALKFGTSGLRGLVTEMTPEAVARYIQAFLAACPTGGTLCLGRDLRPSSPRIQANVARAAVQSGLRVIDCGALPTPALALAAAHHGGGAVMVTGSHIPADRNGLKFYTVAGEISKADEAAILNRMETDLPRRGPGSLDSDTGAAARFTARYITAFGPTALSGCRVGLYAHSAVGRDDLKHILTALGAEVIELERSRDFIPVDTEAVDPDTRARIHSWVTRHALDALVSMDGDSDRPLLADETGAVIPGDILGQITAEALGAEVVVTPISSNSGVMRKGFREVIRTRIGSPYVIAAMAEASGAVVGYEANGGFLLGFTAQGPAGPIAPLRTRDCVLPLVVGLHAARGSTLSARAQQEPPVTTLSDRLQNVPQEKSAALVTALSDNTAARTAFLAPLGQACADIDLTDGVRMTLETGDILHVRPSGNAPELRLYIEADRPDTAQELMSEALDHLAHEIARLP